MRTSVEGKKNELEEREGRREERQDILRKFFKDAPYEMQIMWVEIHTKYLDIINSICLLPVMPIAEGWYKEDEQYQGDSVIECEDSSITGTFYLCQQGKRCFKVEVIYDNIGLLENVSQGGCMYAQKGFACAKNACVTIYAIQEEGRATEIVETQMEFKAHDYWKLVKQEVVGNPEKQAEIRKSVCAIRKSETLKRRQMKEDGIEQITVPPLFCVEISLKII